MFNIIIDAARGTVYIAAILKPARFARQDQGTEHMARNPSEKPDQPRSPNRSLSKKFLAACLLGVIGIGGIAAYENGSHNIAADQAQRALAEKSPCTAGANLGNDYAEYILMNWAQNMWMQNNKALITDEASRRLVDDEFHNKFFGNLTQSNDGLTFGQSLSEKGFITYAYGLTYTVGLVSNDAADAFARTTPVDNWRRDVWRNRFQSRYDVFDGILKETLDKAGPAGAIAAFPKNAGNVNSVAETVSDMGYRTKSVDAATVNSLIRQAGACPASAAPKGPKAS